MGNVVSVDGSSDLYWSGQPDGCLYLILIENILILRFGCQHMIDQVLLIC